MNVNAPETSTTLLRDIAESSNARWSEFASRYRPMMTAFMEDRFPQIDHEDIIQETLVALAKIMPSYKYSPEDKGHFHNYLTGILNNIALKQLAIVNREKNIVGKYCDDEKINRPSIAKEQDDWRKAVFELALRQFLSDDSVKDRTKQIFLRVAVRGEKPDDVAASFGIDRNAVDQIKNRSLAKLKKIVKDLENVGKN